jgi:hypothetical protein
VKVEVEGSRDAFAIRSAGSALPRRLRNEIYRVEISSVWKG